MRKPSGRSSWLKLNDLLFARFDGGPSMVAMRYSAADSRTFVAWTHGLDSFYRRSWFNMR